MSNLLNLDGRVALVTGAGQGVGAEIARHLASSGATVVVNDFYADRAEKVASELASTGASAVGVGADVSDYDDVRRMFQTSEELFGRVDILVNNAGNAGPSESIVETVPFWETSPEDWDRWMRVNYYGVLNSTRLALPGMVERRYGRIVTIVSDAGRVGEPNFVVYAGAKAGATGVMRSVAKAVGRYEITANSIALASTETPTTAPALADEAVRKAMLSHYVVRRLGQPTDAAALALFLASDAASWITGQTYPVNGGYSFSL
ncbi:SDR family oxidoreductase [Streptomyces sp. SRF1]|uniref:SDR family NAD(P)-dependent oxidoreductase n=1 Tax=Streptomyces sp. SRF1 TaxID=1549642 RepID=UPI0025AF6C19|nr:SDR family oxidoreductase [Streptomyces sp. SRF1]MDN3059782.1 SDR family oxidoreductase [Streptomyces sp. SRF1]